MITIQQFIYEESKNNSKFRSELYDGNLFCPVLATMPPDELEKHSKYLPGYDPLHPNSPKNLSHLIQSYFDALHNIFSGKSDQHHIGMEKLKEVIPINVLGSTAYESFRDFYINPNQKGLYLFENNCKVYKTTKNIEIDFYGETVSTGIIIAKPENIREYIDKFNLVDIKYNRSINTVNFSNVGYLVEGNKDYSQLYIHKSFSKKDDFIRLLKRKRGPNNLPDEQKTNQQSRRKPDALSEKPDNYELRVDWLEKDRSKETVNRILNMNIHAASQYLKDCGN